MRSEFEFIHHIKSKYGLKSVGDDCAILPKDDKSDLVVTADMLVEEIDFRLDWSTPEFLGHKALAVSLSDVAAMGGKPESALISIGIPESLWDSDLLDRFYNGWHALAGRYGVNLIGGDISRTPDKLVVDSIVIGSIAKGESILRSGARPGDSVFVSGTLGASAAGLRLLLQGTRHGDRTSPEENELILAQLRPEPRTVLGVEARETAAATSMIDISDGLSSDISHLCEESGVGARLIAEHIPIHTGVQKLFPAPGEALELALHGGEDLELLFTADEKEISAFGLSDISRIGEITANTGIIELISDGKIETLEPKGYRHF
jgi:thiamine-monophosphate kinase